jgi:hypothetical protein
LLPDGVPSVISPPMVPINEAARVSPWMPASTRPIVPGLYECMFERVADPLLLTWTGDWFAFAGKRVQMRTLHKWRGGWA